MNDNVSVPRDKMVELQRLLRQLQDEFMRDPMGRIIGRRIARQRESLKLLMDQPEPPAAATTRRGPRGPRTPESVA